MLSQLQLVYSIPFPGLYAGLLRWVGLLELNFVDMLPLGCVVSLTFYTSLLMRTLALPALSLLLMLLRIVVGPMLKRDDRPKLTSFCKSLLFLGLFLARFASSNGPLPAPTSCKGQGAPVCGPSLPLSDLSINVSRHICDLPVRGALGWFFVASR